MKQLYTAAQIASITGARLLQGSPQTPVTGFAWDSRRVRPGDCFVAMPGGRVDGHEYVSQAVAAGAVCVIAGRPVEAGAAALLLAADPLIALGQLGRHRREQFSIPVVGITGSVGKTTTKEMIAALLAERFAVFRSEGNLNSEVGAPVTLMELDSFHQVAVLEMGMRALGEISYLVSIVRPSIGVVTNVGLTHLELLGTQENIARAKGELIRGLPPDGAAILNADDPRVKAMATGAPARVWYYGLGAEGLGERWVSAGEPARDGESGQRFRLSTSAGRVEVRLPAPGRHMLANAMAAAAVGLELGLDLTQIASGLNRYRPSGNRMRVLQIGGVRLLDDTYNAAPVSVIAALGVMREMAGPDGRCLAVLGDMYELGTAEAEGHRQVGLEAARLADQVIAVGGLAAMIAAAAGSKAVHVQTKPEAIRLLKGMLKAGDTVLVKGSRGLAMEEIIAALEKDLSVQTDS